MSMLHGGEKLGFDRGKAFSNARQSFSSATTCNGRSRSGVTPEQRRETFVVPITDWAIAARLNPFRMLHSERIVNVTLKSQICFGHFHVDQTFSRSGNGVMK
jgi:hypothetical protein